MTITNAELIRKVELVVGLFPGLLFAEGEQDQTSFVDRGEHIDCTFAFQDGAEGKVASLLVQYSLQRHLKRPSDSIEVDEEGRWKLQFESSEFDRVGRALRHASPLILRDAPPTTTKRQPSLAELLSHAVVAFENDYSNARSSGPLPSIQVWSNLLRVLSDEPLDWLEYEKRAIVTKRTKVVVLRHAEKLGLIEVNKRKIEGKSRTLLRLTQLGTTLKSQGASQMRAIEDDWKKQIGSRDFDALRRALALVVQEQDLEYPFFVTGYGPADESVTGGDYRPASEGPPRIPMHGAEFPVVIRHKTKSVQGLPLSALLSQSLMGFAVEYELEQLGQLIQVSRVLAHIPDEGMTLNDASALGNIEGNGKSLHERHLNVVVEPGAPRDGNRLVYLTPKGKHIRNAYPHTVQNIESRWRQRYGSATATIRRVLQEFEQKHGVTHPQYPSPSTWMMPWTKPYVLSDD